MMKLRPAQRRIEAVNNLMLTDWMYLIAPTGGYYKNLYNARQGWIVAEDIFSPARTSGRPVQDLPLLQTWSDVTWLEYVHQCQILGNPGSSPSGLRYIFDKDVTTPRTRATIDEALRRRGVHPADFPGHSFDMTTNEGLAIYSTAHGTGPYWLLADHSVEIGKKISRVTVFNAGGKPQLLWHLVSL